MSGEIPNTFMLLPPKRLYCNPARIFLFLIVMDQISSLFFFYEWGVHVWGESGGGEHSQCMCPIEVLTPSF